LDPNPAAPFTWSFTSSLLCPALGPVSPCFCVDRLPFQVAPTESGKIPQSLFLAGSVGPPLFFLISVRVKGPPKNRGFFFWGRPSLPSILCSSPFSVFLFFPLTLFTDRAGHHPWVFFSLPRTLHGKNCPLCTFVHPPHLFFHQFRFSVLPRFGSFFKVCFLRLLVDRFPSSDGGLCPGPLVAVSFSQSCFYFRPCPFPCDPDKQGFFRSFSVRQFPYLSQKTPPPLSPFSTRTPHPFPSVETERPAPRWGAFGNPTFLVHSFAEYLPLGFSFRASSHTSRLNFVWFGFSLETRFLNLTSFV